MTCKIFVLIVTLLILSIIKISHQQQNGIERRCISINSDTRTFDSLTAYEGNKISFNPEATGFKGNYVKFNFATIDKLPRNAFITFTSDQIIKLILSNKSIQEIEREAFTSLFCLRILDLSHNKIIHLDKSIFDDLNNLEELDLSYNKIEKVYDLVFYNLVNLFKLNLSHNKINEVQSFALMNLTKLQELDLSYNNLREISSTMFTSLKSLKTLNLAYNHFFDLEPEKWIGLDRLTSLDLAGNYLKTFDPSYNFSFAGLQNLNLSANSLTQLNTYALKKYFPKMEQLDINDNEWLCVTLQEIDNRLKNSKINLIGRSNYRTQVNNITCKESEYDYVPISNRINEVTTTERMETSSMPSSTTKSAVFTDLKEIFSQSRQIMYTNHQILDTMNNMKVMMIYLFILVLFVAICNVLYKVGVCNLIYRRYVDRGSTFRGGYIDSSNIENYALIRN